MPRNPDEAIRIESEIETLLISHCRMNSGYRWMRRDNIFIITSPFRSKIQFTISSYMDSKAFVLNTIYKFFNSSQSPVITGLEATVTVLDEQSTVDHIQWVNHQMPWDNRDGYLIHNTDRFSNSESISPAWITLVEDVIDSISNNIGRTLNCSFVNPYTVYIEDAGQNPTKTLNMDIHSFSDKEFAARHIYNQLGLSDNRFHGFRLPEPTQRAIELGHRIADDMFRIAASSFSSIDLPNSATVPINSYTTPSTCIEQEEALDIDYKDDLF